MMMIIIMFGYFLEYMLVNINVTSMPSMERNLEDH